MNTYKIYNSVKNNSITTANISRSQHDADHLRYKLNQYNFVLQKIQLEIKKSPIKFKHVLKSELDM